MTRNNRPRGENRKHFALRAGAQQDTSTGKRSARTTERHGEVRIIGGEWRGRKIRFPAAATLRPTPDRVRETVFNWLQFEVAGARCLDLFAGSGALGFEALSRGAAEVVFVERDPVVAEFLNQTLDALRCSRGRVELRDAFSYLAQPASGPFDVAFLDPPYDERWLERACAALEAGQWLRPQAWVYLEDAAVAGVPALLPGWALVRSKKAGDVGYHLARRGGSP
jgi:16S rRNA (guanine966-N2)-methyltransferase